MAWQTPNVMRSGATKQRQRDKPAPVRYTLSPLPATYPDTGGSSLTRSPPNKRVDRSSHGLRNTTCQSWPQSHYGILKSRTSQPCRYRVQRSESVPCPSVPPVEHVKTPNSAMHSLSTVRLMLPHYTYNTTCCVSIRSVPLHLVSAVVKRYQHVSAHRRGDLAMCHVSVADPRKGVSL